MVLSSNDDNSLPDAKPLPPKRNDRAKHTAMQRELNEKKRKDKHVAVGVGDTYSKHGRLALAIAEHVTGSVGERVEGILVQQRSHTDGCFEQHRTIVQKDLQAEMDKRWGPTEDSSNMTADELIILRKNDYSGAQGKLLKAKLGKQKDDKLKKQQKVEER